MYFFETSEDGAYFLSLFNINSFHKIVAKSLKIL